MESSGDILKNPTDFFKRLNSSLSEIEPKRQEIYKNGYFGEPNTTQTSNFFFDVLMPGLVELDLKVTLYSIRHTFGYGKKGGDFMPETQFLYGTVNKKKQRIDWGCGILTAEEILEREANPKEQNIVRREKAAKKRLRASINRLESVGIYQVVRNLKVKADDKYNTNFYRLLIREEDFK